MKPFTFILLSIAVAVSGSFAIAKGPAPAPAQPKKQNDAVLDFEAEVIQGERRKPDIFIQMGGQSQTMDSIIYLRKDFNDFHKVDADARPDYAEPRIAMPGAGAVAPRGAN